MATKEIAKATGMWDFLRDQNIYATRYNDEYIKRLNMRAEFSACNLHIGAYKDSNNDKR